MIITLLAAGIAIISRPLSLRAERVDGAQPSTPPDTSALVALRAAILQSNPELIARRAAVAAAQARLDAAGFALPLVLSGEVEEVPRGFNVARAGSARITVDRELVSGGRRAAAWSLASADVAAVSAGLYVAEQRVMALGVQALTRAAGWSAIARRLEDEDSTLSSAEGSVRARFAVGGARYVDVLRLRTERLRVEAEQASAVTEARIARQALEALIAGRDALPSSAQVFLDSLIGERIGAFTAVDTAPGPARAQRVQLPPPPDIDSLLVASGVLRVLDASVTQAQAASQLLLANRRSRLTGFLGAQRFLGDGGNFTLGAVAGASISLPFTAGRANATAGAAAQSDVTAALAERSATLSSVRTELLAARARYEAARARFAVYNAALLAGAREERESALAAYRAGTLTLIELLDFERALAAAEIDRLTSRLDAATALTDLLTGATAPPTRIQRASTRSSVSRSPNDP